MTQHIILREGCLLIFLDTGRQMWKQRILWYGGITVQHQPLSAFRKMLFSLSSAEYRDTKRSIVFIVLSHIGYIFSLSDLDMNLLFFFVVVFGR